MYIVKNHVYDNGKVKQISITTVKGAMPSTSDMFTMLSQVSKEEGVPGYNASLYHVRGGYSTYRKERGESGDVLRSNHSAMITAGAEHDEIEQQPHAVNADGSDAGYGVGLDFYEAGYVLSMGKEQPVGLFGIIRPMYFVKITSRHVRYGARSAARVFQTLSSLLRFLQGNREILEYLVSNGGCHLTYEDTCPLSAERVREEEAARKQTATSHKATRERIDALLASINQTACAPEPEPEVRETPAEEAVSRMKEAGIYGPAIQAFRKGKLMMSEPGGLLYDLDEDAKTAIGLARNNKIVPYHVIHQGSVYAVLGVSDPEMSDHKEAWADEHISRDGWVPAFVYNTQFGEDCAEWGEIQVASINGGMQLLAVREDRHYNHPR